MSKRTASCHLLVALTPGVALSDWARKGYLERELRPFEYHVSRGGTVTFLETACGARVGLPRGMKSTRAYHWRLLPLWQVLSARSLATVDVIRTNQSYRAAIFVRMGLRSRIPVILRCGYVRGQSLELAQGRTPDVLAYQEREGWAFRNANLVQLPTIDLADWVVAEYGCSREKIRVVPNFVDTQVFATADHAPSSESASVVSVGRLHPVKRYDMLVEACRLAGITDLRIAGQGIARNDLMRRAEESDIRLALPGKIHNSQVPRFLGSGSIFAMTSQYEGHPKALIEAMACGLPCVCVDVPGIRSVIRNEENGLLVEPTAAAVADGLKRLKDDPNLRRKLGTEARRFVIEEYDARSVLLKDQQVIEEAARLSRR